MTDKLKIGDKVKNMDLIGKIIDIKIKDTPTGLITCYFIKYPLFTFKNPFRRKLWTLGLDLEKIEDGN